MKYDDDIERRLERFFPRPPDSGRKERILRGAAEMALGRLVLTPAWKWTVAGCTILLLAVFLIDGWTSATGCVHLHVLLGIPEQDAMSLEKTVEAELAAYQEALPDLDKSATRQLHMELLEEKRAGEIKWPLDHLEEAIHED